MKLFIKKNIKFIIVILICITCSVLTTFATDYLFNSNEVKYNNTTSGIQAGDVQGAIDELYACASNYAAYNQRLTTVESQIYPVGSIYISVSSTNPSTLFGGTWEAFGSGKTIVGINTNDTDFDTVEESHGSKTVTLTTNNLPSHTHTVTAAGSVGAHTHTVTAAGSVGAHTHTVTAKGSVSSSFTGSSTNTSSNGYHQHTGNNGGAFVVNGSGNTINLAFGGGGLTITDKTNYSGAHTHTVTATGTVSSTFTGSSTNTSSVTPTFTGSSTNTSSVTPTFTGSSTNTSAIGKATPDAISTMNPYITVYMWKRVS